MHIYDPTGRLARERREQARKRLYWITVVSVLGTVIYAVLTTLYPWR